MTAVTRLALTDFRNYADAVLEARDVFKEQGIDSVLFQDDSRPTTVKHRYRANNKTLLRVSELRQHAVSAEIAEK